MQQPQSPLTTAESRLANRTLGPGLAALLWLLPVSPASHAQDSEFLPDALKTTTDAPKKPKKAPTPTPEEIEAREKLEAKQRELEKVRLEKEEAKRKLDKERQELEDARNREQAVVRDVNALEEERAKLNSQLIETARRIQESEATLLATEDRLMQFAVEEARVRGSIDDRHDTIAKLLGAMQRIGRQPPPPLVTRRDDALKMVRSAMLLASILPELETQAVQLTGDLEALVDLQENTRIEQIRVKEESKTLAADKRQIDALLVEKKGHLTERQIQLASIQEAAQRHSTSLNRLDEFLSRMDEEIEATVRAIDRGESAVLEARRKATEARLRAEEARRKAEEARRKAEEARRKAEEARELAKMRVAEEQRQAKMRAAEERRQAEIRAVEAQRQAEMRALEAEREAERRAAEERRLAEIQAAERKALGDKPAVELMPKRRVALASPGRIKPAAPFASARGRLPLPAPGRRLTAFAEADGFGGKSKGVRLETREKAQITSPMDGWVVYSGPFRSYGQLLIINAGEGYHVLLAGMSQIDVSLGQFVLKGEPVAVMSASAKDSGEAELKRPVLYVEFRKDGRPIDPDPWWAEGPRKVQG